VILRDWLGREERLRGKGKAVAELETSEAGPLPEADEALAEPSVSGAGLVHVTPAAPIKPQSP